MSKRVKSNEGFAPGWAEAFGRQPQRGRPDPRTVYTPRVDGVMPEVVRAPESDEAYGELEDAEDDSPHGPVPVDTWLRRRGVR